MADISSYIEYFRKIANEHKEINGFYMMDINEILDGLRSNVKYPAMILENISGSYLASNLDNPLEVINGGFLIIDHIAWNLNPSGITQIINYIYEFFSK
jgi:hypothetical protein